jgi:hypothetical protein
VTDAYERVRFGAIALTRDETQLVESAVAALEGGNMISRQPGGR